MQVLITLLILRTRIDEKNDQFLVLLFLTLLSIFHDHFFKLYITSKAVRVL